MIACSVCASEERRPIIRAGDPERAVWLLRCDRCGLVQPERLPTEAELHAYYRTYSYGHAESWRIDPATEVSLKALAATLERYRRSARLLDVGCGAGAVLKAMSTAGWHAEGQEISTEAAGQLSREGFRIHACPLEEMQATDPFDVIVISEVIEHLPAPHIALAAANRLLRPGGVLYLTTPNFGSLSRRVLREQWRAIDVPEHLSYFDDRALRGFLERAGFRRVRVWSEGLNPYELTQGRRPRETIDKTQLRSQTEKLRLAAAKPGPARLLKRLANVALRLGSLGDTLKTLAEK